MGIEGFARTEQKSCAKIIVRLDKGADKTPEIIKSDEFPAVIRIGDGKYVSTGTFRQNETAEVFYTFMTGFFHCLNISNPVLKISIAKALNGLFNSILKEWMKDD